MFVATTVYWYSKAVSAGVVYEELVAPAIGTFPLVRYHRNVIGVVPAVTVAVSVAA
jgi:hypothetical protein